MIKKKLWAFVVILGTVCIPLLWPSSVRADNVVQNLYQKSKMEIGTIVRLSSESAVTIEKVPGGRSDMIFGVVIDESKAPVVLQRSGASAYIASQGDYPVLVSTEHGPIAAGDYISMSSTDGIGAKATGNESTALGKTKTAFDGSSGVVKTEGNYKVGLLTVSIEIGKNPSFKNTLAIPAPLQKIGNSIAGKETSPLKVYIGLVLFVVGSVLTMVLITFGTRGGLVAIGRNPLSKHAVLTALFQVITAAVVIFLTSIIGVYLLLRL